MVATLPASVGEVSCGASMVKMSADIASGTPGCQPICWHGGRMPISSVITDGKLNSAAPRMRLTDIFYVTDNAIIDRTTFGIQFAVIMPAGVAVSVEALANQRTSYVRIAVHMVISTGCINSGNKISRGADVDGLRDIGIRRTDGIILKVRRSEEHTS